MATVQTTYRYLVVAEDGLGLELRHGLAMLLAATLDDGEVYRRRAWRTVRPTFRVVALQADGEPVGRLLLVTDRRLETAADEKGTNACSCPDSDRGPDRSVVRCS
jgi:hypothetical protein